MILAPKHPVFRFLDLPRELRDWTYRIILEGPCTHLAVSRDIERDDDDTPQMMIGYRAERTNTRSVLNLLQINSQIRTETLWLLHKASPYKFGSRIEEYSYGFCYYDIPTFFDISTECLIDCGMEQYILDCSVGRTFYPPMRMPSFTPNTFLSLLTRVSLVSTFFPAVSPCSTECMVQLASLPSLCSNLKDLEVYASISGMMACLAMPSMKRPGRKITRARCTLARSHISPQDLKRLTLEQIVTIPAMYKLSQLTGLKRFRLHLIELKDTPHIPPPGWSDHGTGCKCQTPFSYALYMREIALTAHYARWTVPGMEERFSGEPLVDGFD